jgi:inosose dehydratase
MLIGNAPCSWGVYYPDSRRITAEGYLDAVAAAGYRATELGPFGFLPTDAGALADALAARGLTLVGAAHVHAFGDPGGAAGLAATLRALAALLVSQRAPEIVLMDESEWYPEGGPRELDPDGWRRMTRLLGECRAMLAGDYGVRLSFHPHVGTAVERERQIDRLLADTPLDLCFDTGHHAFWDQDPLAYMDKVRDRIAYVHLKNVDPAVRARVLAGELSVAASFAEGVMCPLPDGAVDIAAVVRRLEAAGFSGPVVVEQDLSERAAETPEELARRNLEFLAGLPPA